MRTPSNDAKFLKIKSFIPTKNQKLQQYFGFN